MRTLKTVVFSLLLMFATWAQAETETVARIFEKSGIRGGLVVEMGFSDAEFTARLGNGQSVSVQTLEGKPERVVQARKALEQKGVYGKISVEHLKGNELPYADNLVNLFVVHGAIGDGGVPQEEFMRVLAPGGAICSEIGSSKSDASRTSEFQIIRKPWPAEIDQWTHFLHSAAGNAVAADQQVAPATALQWIVDPKYCRSHEIDSSLPAMVSANGRLFYFLDEGPTGITDPRFPARWTLIARDAFNGVLLWKRPLESWGWQQWKPEIADVDWRTLRGQRGKFPSEVPRRLVAVGDRVYVTLGFHDAPVSILDATTGDVQKRCEGTEGTQEIVVDNETIFVRVQSSQAEAAKRRGQVMPTSLVALDSKTGERKWAQEVTRINPLTLAASGDSVVFLRGQDLVCYEQANGRLRWNAKCPRSGIVVIHKDVVLTTGKEGTHAFSLDNGKHLWKGPDTGRDLLVIDDLVWRVQATPGILAEREEHWPTLSRQAGAKLFGYDFRTGELRRNFEVANAMSPGHHLRCYRSKATDRFILYPKRGAEFLDLDGDNHMRHDWLRGSCRFGVVPCNGLLYTPPDQCFCYIGAKMEGLVATSGAKTTSMLDPHSPERLSKGPAYEIETDASATKADWPAYRADAERSGSNPQATVSQHPSMKWDVTLGGKLTQPVIAAGKVFVAAVDAHTVHAFAAESGRELWKFTAGGRIDSSPTYHNGLLLFGANDGRAYCLNANDGQLVWHFLAAPNERRIAAYGQVESPWPVHGSVLVLNSLAYFAAGRSTLVDGGAHFYGIEPQSGKIVRYCHVEQSQPDLSKDIGEHFAMDGSNIDILTTDGDHIFCMQEMFDTSLNHIKTDWNTRHGDRYLGKDHLMATGGLLDDTGFNRIYWTYGNRWPGFYFMLMAPKSGNLLVFDQQHTFATKWFVERNIHSALFFPETTGYLLFCDQNTTCPFLVGDPDAPKPIKWLPDTLMEPYRYDGRTISNRHDDFTVEVDKGAGFTRSVPTVWQQYLPVRIEAMALTRDTLYAAGVPDVAPKEDPLSALEGRSGGVLVAIDPTTGERISQQQLASAPRFDGMATAGKCLFFVTEDGRLTAWE
jgi:outer membrane protein assembly factor BamB